MADKWQPVHYLSWEETQNAGWGFWTDEPGYDQTKHEANERGEVIFPREVLAEPGSTVKTHWEYEQLTAAEAEQILADQRAAEDGSEARFRAAGSPMFDEQPQVSAPDWEIRRYLSYGESDHGYSSDPTGVPGYDPTKHDPSPMPMNQYIFPSVNPLDGEQGHFEYHPLVDYSKEPMDPNPPTIPAVDTDTELDVVLHAGEGMTYVYWQPADWAPPEWDPHMVSNTYDEDSFMKAEDMHTAFAGRSHHIIGTMDNKIVLETATDPANYDVEEWDPELGLAKYRLVLRRHEAMPAEYISRVLADPIIEEVVITGITFNGDGALLVDISHQGLTLPDLNFKIPTGGYRVVACISGRQTADETVMLDMWLADNPSAADEVLKVEGAWGRSRLYPPDPRSSFYHEH